MEKPALFRLQSWLARRAPQTFESLVRAAILFELMSPWRRPAVERAQTRVLRFCGQPVTPARLRSNFAAMAGLYADAMATLFTLTRQEASRWRDRIELPALSVIRRAREDGKGVILATPHFGNTTLATAALVKAGLPLTVVFVNAEPFRWMCEFGLKVVSLGYGASEMIAALARNEAVLLTSDIDFFPDERTMDFFGAPARPPHGPARLALASGAPIVPVYAVFAAGRHRLEADDPIFPSQAGGGGALLAKGEGQQALEWELLRSMESFIGRNPDHWLLFEDIWDLARVDRKNRRRFAKLQAYRKFRKAIEPGFQP